MTEENQINWRDKPICANRWSDDATHILYVDENGHSNLKNIISCIENNNPVQENEKYFNICTTLITKENHNDIALSLVNIKHKYWLNGKYSYKGVVKSVCLHSDEIRKMTGPFSKNTINHESFFEDMNSTMSNMELMVFDCFINKEKFYLKYLDAAIDPYAIGIQYILERIVNKQLGSDDKVMIVCESRGAKEDIIVLDTIKLLMAKGTYYVSSKQFNKITGIYFNPKRSSDNSKSYIGLEIADLCAYPIYKYAKHGTKDQPFRIIETKIHGYPYYEGKGLKRVP